MRYTQPKIQINYFADFITTNQTAVTPSAYIYAAENVNTILFENLSKRATTTEIQELLKLN